MHTKLRVPWGLECFAGYGCCVVVSWKETPPGNPKYWELCSIPKFSRERIIRCWTFLAWEVVPGSWAVTKVWTGVSLVWLRRLPHQKCFVCCPDCRSSGEIHATLSYGETSVGFCMVCCVNIRLSCCTWGWAAGYVIAAAETALQRKPWLCAAPRKAGGSTESLSFTGCSSAPPVSLEDSVVVLPCLDMCLLHWPFLSWQEGEKTPIIPLFCCSSF